MMDGRARWPIQVESAGEVSAGAVAWRRRDRLFVTVIVKASFQLVSEDRARQVTAAPLVLFDQHHEGDPTRSLARASDLCPYRQGAEVLLVGSAFTKPAGPMTTQTTRLVLVRDERPLLDKTVLVQGDRPTGGAQRPEPRPFRAMPLVYERTAADPETNPVGVDVGARHGGSGREPNLLHPHTWGLPACYAPLSPRWPIRRRHLSSAQGLVGLGGDRPDPAGAPLVIPDDLDARYFQAAPPDQHIDVIRGDEWILLEGLHPAAPRLRTRLPGLRGVASVMGGKAPHRVELWGDTLLIDSDRQIASITWRAGLPVTGNAALASMRVAVALEPLDGATPAPPAPSRPPPSAARASTVALDFRTVLAAKPATPFQPPAGSPAKPHPFASTVDAEPSAAARPALPFRAPSDAPPSRPVSARREPPPSVAPPSLPVAARREAPPSVAPPPIPAAFPAPPPMLRLPVEPPASLTPQAGGALPEADPENAPGSPGAHYLAALAPPAPRPIPSVRAARPTAAIEPRSRG